MASIHENIMRAVQRGIRALKLDGLPDAKVLIGKIPDEKKLADAAPVVMIAPFGQKTVVQSTNREDDIGYGVVVVVVEASDGTQLTNRRRHLEWVELIGNEFYTRRLDDVDECWGCDVVSDAVFDFAAFQNKLDLSYTAFRFKTRETRNT